MYAIPTLTRTSQLCDVYFTECTHKLTPGTWPWLCIVVSKRLAFLLFAPSPSEPHCDCVVSLVENISFSHDVTERFPLFARPTHPGNTALLLHLSMFFELRHCRGHNCRNSDFDVGHDVLIVNKFFDLLTASPAFRNVAPSSYSTGWDFVARRR